MLSKPAAATKTQLRALVLAAATAGCGANGDPSTTGPPFSPYPRPTYTRLSETGLYSDTAPFALASDVAEFAPSYRLWSDGAEKARFISLPPGARIDTRDMNRWTFPIGTRVWKEFSLAGQRLETRLVERYGQGPEDYWLGSFVWDEAQSDATFAEEGEADILGTDHDAPAARQCWSCHNGEPGRLLGFSALQLSHTPSSDEDLTLERLSAAGRLSAPPMAGEEFAPPGDDATRVALGYLHANCGHCHNWRGTSWPDTQMVLRLDVEEVVPEESALYKSVVGKRLTYFRDDVIDYRVLPGDPEHSAVVSRMNVRTPREQMPPLATELVDEEGLELVRTWVQSLAP